MDKSERMVLWLSRRMPESCRSLVGPKAMSLCTLRRLGLKVPPCFFLTTTAFGYHLDSMALRSQMASLTGALDASAHDVLPVLEEIRQLIIGSALPDHVYEQVAAAHQRLGAETVAVRSSATAEDLPGQSFAGQYETVLNVTSLDACLAAIKRCWASLWTERAYEYRQRQGIEHQQVEMAVIVQRQIDADAAGVAFSVDPVRGCASRIVIEACRGLGEALVSGRVQPDRILLRKKNLDLARQSLATSEPALDLRSARKLGRYVRRIEKRLGSPQDIEWAIDDRVLWFLQTRPITAVAELKPWEERQVWTNLNLGEVVPDVMTPMTWSMIEMVFISFFEPLMRLFGVAAEGHPPAALVAGRLYWNINLGLAVALPFVSMSKLNGANSVFGGAQGRMHELGQWDMADEDLPDLGFRWSKYILSWPGILRDLYAHRTSQNDKLLVHMRQRNDQFDCLDIDALETDELARMIGETLPENFRDLDLLLLLPGALAVGLFQRVCRRWLGDEDLILAYRLLAAQGGIADTEAGLDMWRLAVLAHADERIETALLAEDSWQRARERLSETEHGCEFLTAWERFMAEHGHHGRGELEFFNARWAERPDYILNLVRNYLRSIGRTDPLVRQQDLARQREELIQDCRRRLRNPIKRGLFNWSLRRTQKVARDRENWKNEMVRMLAGFRRVLLTLGQRLHKRGTLGCRDDIFFLQIPEICPVAKGSADFDVKQRIAMRRAEYERNCAVTPPPVVVGHFDPDKQVAPEVEAGADLLEGIAVSPGVVTGRARVILKTDDRQHVEGGEILVAPFTDPAWTPYFIPAAGVVMDLGGILSHGAIIAREYGIPAVVNVGSATRIIKTGQKIRVDGDHGTVIILE